MKDIKEEAERYYDNNLGKYNLLNVIDPATAQQAIKMMTEFASERLEEVEQYAKDCVDELRKTKEQLQKAEDYIDKLHGAELDAYSNQQGR